MKNILSHRHRVELLRFLRKDPVLIFDFDGTLSPIVKAPDRARMRKSTRELLQRMTRRFRCAVLSGRGRADVKRRMAGVRLVSVIGNHGIETGTKISAAARLRREVARWAEELRSALPSPGIRIEDKGYSLSVHYHAPARRGRVLSAVADLNTGRIIAGKNVINILPRGAPDKGRAVRRFLKESGASHAVFVGDDETDEYVFALGRPGRLWTIRVGKSSRSRAEYFLKKQADIDELLKLLLLGD